MRHTVTITDQFLRTLRDIKRKDETSIRFRWTASYDHKAHNEISCLKNILTLFSSLLNTHFDVHFINCYRYYMQLPLVEAHEYHIPDTGTPANSRYVHHHITKTYNLSALNIQGKSSP